MSVSLSSLGSLTLTAANNVSLSIRPPASVATARTITFFEPDADAVIAYIEKSVVAVAAASVTLTTIQSGSLISITKGAGTITITLPSPTSGLEYDFVQAGAVFAQITRIDAGAGLLFGSWINTVGGTLTGATTAGVGARFYNFTAVSVIGDGVRFVSDGTYWYARGMIGVAAGASFT